MSLAHRDPSTPKPGWGWIPRPPENAPCSRSPHLFDPWSSYETNQDFMDRFRRAVAICSSCPLKKICIDYMTKQHLDGVGGGFYFGYLPRAVRTALPWAQIEPPPVGDPVPPAVVMPRHPKLKAGPVTWSYLTGHPTPYQTIVQVLGEHKTRYNLIELQLVWVAQVEDKIPLHISLAKPTRTTTSMHFLGSEPRDVPALVAALDYHDLTALATRYTHRGRK